MSRGLHNQPRWAQGPVDKSPIGQMRAPPPYSRAHLTKYCRPYKTRRQPFSALPVLVTPPLPISLPYHFDHIGRNGYFFSPPSNSVRIHTPSSSSSSSPPPRPSPRGSPWWPRLLLLILLRRSRSATAWRPEAAPRRRPPSAGRAPPTAAAEAPARFALQIPAPPLPPRPTLPRARAGSNFRSLGFGWDSARTAGVELERICRSVGWVGGTA